MTGTLLAFDTSGPWCAGAVVLDGVVHTRCEAMVRGQAERLMLLLEEMLAEVGLTWRAVTRIGVGVGPGNFTGIRISVAAARGLALGLEVPVVGVSSFDALRGGTEGRAAVPAPREMAYLAEGAEPPRIIPRSDVPGDALWADAGLALVEGIARQAAGSEPGPLPAPLYLRAADAAPPRDAPPVLLDDA